jgi:high-affinity K+ transport system ATPase subunit B
MSNKKAKEEAAEQRAESKVEIPAELLKKIQDEATDKAFRELCKLQGVDPDALKKQSALQEKAEEIIEYDIGTLEVQINGLAYRGKGEGPRGLVEQIMHAAGSKRMRLIREAISHEGIIEQVAGGGFVSRIKVKTPDPGAI